MLGKDTKKMLFITLAFLHSTLQLYATLIVLVLAYQAYFSCPVTRWLIDLFKNDLVIGYTQAMVSISFGSQQEEGQPAFLCGVSMFSRCLRDFSGFLPQTKNMLHRFVWQLNFLLV